MLNSSAQVTSRAVLHPSVDQDGYIVKVCSEYVLSLQNQDVQYAFLLQLNKVLYSFMKKATVLKFNPKFHATGKCLCTGASLIWLDYGGRR